MKTLFNENVQKLKGRIANYQAAKDQKARERQVLFGAQDSLDVLSYSGLEEQPNYLILDGRYVRTLSVAGFPLTAHIGWLDNLVNFHGDIDVSYHVDAVEAISALPKLHRKVTELESRRRQLEREGRIVGSEITDPLESAMDLRDAILRGQEKLFLVSISATLTAASLEELNKKSTLLETVLSAHLFYTKDAYWRQLEGLQTVLPRAEDMLKQKRNLDSSSAALLFPFVSSELTHEDGIMYGVNLSNNSLVILDRYALNNANSITFAQSGSGKSYASKVEILRQLMQGTKVIVIDPEREYVNLCESVGGTYIKLSASSKQKINPLDLASASRDREQLAEHAQELIEIISLMIGTSNGGKHAYGLEPQERAALDKAIMAAYKNTEKGKTPLLSDLYAELKNLGHHAVCERLDTYLSGTLAGVFNKPTNVKLDNRLVVFDIQELDGSLKQIMMMIVSNFVQNQVKSKPEKRLLVIDEAWLMLEHEQSARFVSGLVRRARKYYLGVSIISQQANDFLDNKYGRAIASQSALRILMRQDTTTIQNVVEHFNLSSYEHNFLLTCDRGEALLIADQNHVAARVVASAEEHPLITTNPKELHGTSD